MGIAARALVPMARVADVARSIRFYEALGFAVRNTFVPDGAAAPSWAWLESRGAALMVTSASAAPVPEEKAALFYVYGDDVAAAHAECVRAGLDPGPIAFPFYAPRGEFRLKDPDGWLLMITHA
ncbi:MAG TPA: VOC family protein [Thermoanaerobaculia bacterium]|nr:VOC family protein [Thermoanaerobaculia bacterium]